MNADLSPPDAGLCKGFVTFTTGRSGIGTHQFQLIVDVSQHPSVIQFEETNDNFQLVRVGPEVAK